MKRKREDIDALDAKVWITKQRFADPKTGHTDCSQGTPCFQAIKQFLQEQEPDADPWDQRTIVALDGYDNRHKPPVSPDPRQGRLFQERAEWKLDSQRRISIPEGEANVDDIDLRETILDETFHAQQAIYRKEKGYLDDSRKKAKTRKQKMKEIWKPDNLK
jgi:hypothetical protein